MLKIRVAGIARESIVDGPGLRYVLFAQGCDRHCKGCHNENTHSLNTGQMASPSQIVEDIKRNPLLDGITLSGGEPFLQPEPLAELARLVHGLGLSVWTYSGYTYEEILKGGEAFGALLSETDILVDGPYVEELRSPELRFRGSSNQRLIDVRQSEARNEAVQL